jgi:hypothetical protein
MALNKDTLSQALKTTFQTAKDKSWSAGQVADSLGAAINAFVLNAEVTGVNVNVVNPSNVPIGTGAQSGVGKLQ